MPWKGKCISICSLYQTKVHMRLSNKNIHLCVPKLHDQLQDVKWTGLTSDTEELFEVSLIKM